MEKDRLELQPVVELEDDGNRINVDAGRLREQEVDRLQRGSLIRLILDFIDGAVAGERRRKLIFFLSTNQLLSCLILLLLLLLEIQMQH